MHVFAYVLFYDISSMFCETTLLLLCRNTFGSLTAHESITIRILLGDIEGAPILQWAVEVSIVLAVHKHNQQFLGTVFCISNCNSQTEAVLIT